MTIKRIYEFERANQRQRRIRVQPDSTIEEDLPLSRVNYQAMGESAPIACKTQHYLRLNTCKVKAVHGRKPDAVGRRGAFA